MGCRNQASYGEKPSTAGLSAHRIVRDRKACQIAGGCFHHESLPSVMWLKPIQREQTWPQVWSKVFSHGRRDLASLGSARPGCRRTYLNKEKTPQRVLVGGRVQLVVCFHSTMARNTGRCIRRGAEKRDGQIDPALYATTV